MGTRKRRYRKCLDAVVQAIVHVPTRLHEGHTRPEKCKELLQVFCLALSHWPGTLPGRLLYLAGSGAGYDQRCRQGLSQTDSGSEGHCRVGKSLMQNRRYEIL